MLSARPRAPRLVLALALACALAACGKSSGPVRSLAPVAEQGAVSVVTGNTTRIGGADAATDAAAVARSVYPGLTTATRPQAIVLVDESDWHAALAASVLASVPLGAPLLYARGSGLPSVSGEAVSALKPLGAPSLGGARLIRIGESTPEPEGLASTTVATAGGAALTAVSVERLLARARGSHPHQVIVLPSTAPRALAMPAAGLAAESGAPILYASSAGVPRVVEYTLTALHHPSIYVLGSGELHHSTMQVLRGYGHVTAINGASSPGGEDRTPAGNAIAVARFTDGTFGWGVKEPGHGLVFANAARPLDGPAAALLSASSQYAPLLLLEHSRRIPASLATYLSNIQPAYASAPQYQPVHGAYNHGWLIGDETMISSVTQAELDSLLQIIPSKQSGEEAAGQAEQTAAGTGG